MDGSKLRSSCSRHKWHLEAAPWVVPKKPQAYIIRHIPNRGRRVRRWLSTVADPRLTPCISRFRDRFLAGLGQIEVRFEAVVRQIGTPQMTTQLSMLIVVFACAIYSVAFAQDSARQKPPKQMCQLVSTNPPDFDLYQFLPQKMDLTRINRSPKVSYEVGESGIVSSVKILKSTGSPKIDSALVKSILAWKYKPQPGCRFELSMEIILEIGHAEGK